MPSQSRLRLPFCAITGSQLISRSLRRCILPCPSISALWHRSHFWVPVFGLTGKSKRNLINVRKQSSWQEALVKELSSYEYAPLREGEIALYRGSGNGLAPILLVAAEETSVGCVERLEHEHALKSQLHADLPARPLALADYNHPLSPTREDPCGAPL